MLQVVEVVLLRQPHMHAMRPVLLGRLQLMLQHVIGQGLTLHQGASGMPVVPRRFSETLVPNHLCVTESP